MLLISPSEENKRVLNGKRRRIFKNKIHVLSKRNQNSNYREFFSHRIFTLIMKQIFIINCNKLDSPVKK